MTPDDHRRAASRLLRQLSWWVDDGNADQDTVRRACVVATEHLKEANL